jgi:hypothetical protein
MERLNVEPDMGFPKFGQQGSAREIEADNGEGIGGWQRASHLASDAYGGDGTPAPLPYYKGGMMKRSMMVLQIVTGSIGIGLMIWQLSGLACGGIFMLMWANNIMLKKGDYAE